MKLFDFIPIRDKTGFQQNRCFEEPGLRPWAGGAEGLGCGEAGAKPGGQQARCDARLARSPGSAN